MDRLHAELAFHDQQAHARRQAWACSPSEHLRFDPDWYLDHETWIRPAFALLGEVTGKRVLDYGCGHGMAGILLARRGADVTAFDLSGGYVAEAHSRAAVNAPAARYQSVQAVGERLPFADASFDRIWGHAILHHLDLPLAAAELRRVLRPDGWAVFCEPWGGNPLIEWARQRLPYPGKHRTVDEQPLQPGDVDVLQQFFSQVQVFPQQLLGGLPQLRRETAVPPGPGPPGHLSLPALAPITKILPVCCSLAQTVSLQWGGSTNLDDCTRFADAMNAPTPSPAAPPPIAPAPTWPRSTELALTFILGICTAFILQALWHKWGVAGQPATALSVPGLDLNGAQARELAQVPGLGPRRAQQIVDHREANGPFTRPDDLHQVKGIGGRTAERVRKHLQTTAPPGEETPAALPRGRKSEPAVPINLNLATSGDLQRLPGIGPVLAQRILEHRAAQGPFRDVKELLKIKGIKEKTLEKLLPYVTLGNEVTAMTP